MTDQPSDKPEQRSTASVEASSLSSPGPAVSKVRVLVNVASNWVQLVVHIVTSLILFPFLVNQLGETAYGVWATLAGLLGFLMLLDVGSTSAINRYVARYGALGELGRINATVASGFALFLGIASALVLVSFFLARPFIALFPLIPAELIDDSVLTLQLIFLGVGIRLLHGPFAGLMAGWHRYDLLNAVYIFELVLRVVLIFVLMLTWRVSIYVPALAFVIANAIGLFAQIGVAKWLFHGLRILPTAANRASLKEILTLGSHVLLITLCTITIYQGPNFILMRFVGPEAVTPFSIGLLLITTCTQGVHGVSRVFTPLISSVDARRDTSEVVRLTVRVSQVFGVFTAGIVTMLIVIGRPFLAIWMDGQVPSAYTVVAILVVAHIFHWPNTVIQSAFSGTSRLGPYALGWLVTAVLIVILAVVLVMTTTWEGVAIAIAITLPMILQQALLVPYLFQRYFGADGRRFVLQVYLRPLRVAVLIGCPSYAAITHWAPETWFQLSLWAIGVGIAYAIGAFFLGADAESRALLTSMLRGRPSLRKTTVH